MLQTAFHRSFAPPLRRAATRAALVLSLAAMLAGPAAPGRATAATATLTVIGDVNAGAADNLRLYDNVRAGGTSVLFARDFGPLTGVVGHYRNRGVDPMAHGTALTATVLAGTDLLVMTANYNTAMDFTAAELGAVRDYGLGGGRILFVAEAARPPVLANYNAVLDAIGARIRFTGLRFALTEQIGDLPETPVGDGLSVFRLTPHNTLAGGTTAVRATNGPAIAFETLGAPAPIPLPAAGPLMATGVGLLLTLGWLRRRTGPDDAAAAPPRPGTQTG